MTAYNDSSTTSYTTAIDGFTCSDDCVISDIYVNDGYCDCTDCGDEDGWTCSTCEDGCPDSCGGYEDCGSSGGGSSSNSSSNLNPWGDYDGDCSAV